jgi:hypothetical protein
MFEIIPEFSEIGAIFSVDCGESFRGGGTSVQTQISDLDMSVGTSAPTQISDFGTSERTQISDLGTSVFRDTEGFEEFDQFYSDWMKCSFDNHENVKKSTVYLMTKWKKIVGRDLESVKSN